MAESETAASGPISTIVHRYDAATAKHGFWSNALAAPNYVRECVRSKALLWNFAKRELLGRFRGSAGGILWVLVQPIFLFVVYFLVFGILFAPKDDLLNNGPSTLFALYLFSGIIYFTAVLESTNLGLASVVANGNLVKKVAFPCELLPLTPVLVATAVYLVGCVVLLAVGLWIGDVQITAKMLWWPVLILCMIVYATGFSLFLAAANVFSRDTAQLYAIVGQAWFFLTPIFWRMDFIAAKAEAFGMTWIFDVLLIANPAHGLSLAQRQIVDIGHNIPPAEYAANFPHSLETNLAVGAAWALVSFVVGYGFFMSRKHKFADLV